MRFVAFAVVMMACGSSAMAAAPDGASLFAQRCAGCHQAHGEGIPGVFPALAQDQVVNGDADGVATVLLNGRGGMPSFRNGLTDDQLAAVSTYIRSSWGNKAAPIPADTFTRLRSATPDKNAHP